jgi:hypothetical protein
MEKLTDNNCVHIKIKILIETEFLDCLYTIKNFLLSKDHSKILQKFKCDLRVKFNIETNSVQHITNLLMKTFNAISVSSEDTQIFLRVMQTKWMKFNTGDTILSKHDLYHHSYNNGFYNELTKNMLVIR